MYRLLLFLLLMAGFFSPVYSQVVFNEIQTSNKSTLADEDGDYDDWIELYNAGSQDVDLTNYGLTDNASNPYKWKFPSLILPPSGRMLVYASGKNRKPEINHWEAAVSAENIWRYFVGTQEPPTGWNGPGFNASAWLQGPGGIGYGDNDDGTIIPASISVYMVRSFNVTDTSKIADCIFSMDYDDGFVAYLNGVEIARSNINGMPPAYNQTSASDREAHMYQGGLPENYHISNALLSSILTIGTNVLAVQTHNISQTSSDLSSIPFLLFGIRDNTTQFQPAPAWFTFGGTGSLHTNFKLKHSGETLRLTTPGGSISDTFSIRYSDVNHSHCRIPDGATSWCITCLPTPSISNNTSICYAGYTDKPLLSVFPGFYNGAQQVSITSPQPAATIRYTLNGNIPNSFDPIYTQPINVNKTEVLRARCFGPQGYLPGRTATATYFIGSQYTLPVVSISTDSLNLWSYNTGIYVMGPFADPDFPYFGANFWQPWEKDCHMEYFGTMQPRQFELDAGLSIHGGWSRAFAQRSFNIKTHAYYDSSGIRYKLFGDKPITEFKSLILRNSGNDWMNTHIRDALMQRSMRNTYVDYMAYSPSVVYLNGKYWGIYNIRERNNADFIEENHGVNADSVDVIESDGIVLSGNSDDFWQMVTYVTTHELSVASNYAVASSWINTNNLADYFIAETYFVNNDWLGNWTNNIKLWRERKAGSKWNYMLWDMDFGLGYQSSYNENKLAVAMNPPVATPHADIFSHMLQNPGFRKYFINRYADLLNTVYMPASMNALVTDMRDSIGNEMYSAWYRWFGNYNLQTWNNNLNILTTFINNRPLFARQHIVTDFGLGGQVQVKLDVAPAATGFVKINTIIPGPLPWNGIYFKGNPVTITAVAKPGYTFQYWMPNSYIGSDTNRTLTINLDHFDTFKAVFFGTAQDAQVTFSEINYHSDSTRDAGDWIELHNYSDSPLDITDWQLVDSNFYHAFTFATGTIIPANGYLVVSENPQLFHSQFPDVPCTGPVGFGLSNHSENIALLNFLHDTIVSCHYNDSNPWPPAADGLGHTLELRQITSAPNDPTNWFAGCIGGSPGEAYQSCEEEVVFSEINYNSADWSDPGDWVEIRNKGNSLLDISGWKFSDSDNSHALTFAAGTQLEPGGFIVLPGDDTKFTQLFPAVTNKTSAFNFGLSGSGEALRLFDAGGKIYSSVVYNDKSPWPLEADGFGYTLELADPNGIICDGENWFAGCPGGSPGGPYIFPCYTSLTEHPDNVFKVFPNPATTQLYIINNGNISGNADLTLIDALGRIVLEKQVEVTGGAAIRLSLNGLVNGIYILRIQLQPGNEPEMVRVVVAN